MLVTVAGPGVVLRRERDDAVGGTCCLGVRGGDSSAGFSPSRTSPSSPSSASAWGDVVESLSRVSARAGAVARGIVTAMAAEKAQKRVRKRMGVVPPLLGASSTAAVGGVSGGSDGARYPTETLLSTPCFTRRIGCTRVLCTAPRPRDGRYVEPDLTQPLPATCGNACQAASSLGTRTPDPARRDPAPGWLWGQSARASSTRVLAASCTWPRCSSPLNDSA